MNSSEELTLKKKRHILYGIIGRKISESRKSSRRKFEGISKKLNISTEILKKIEAGLVEDIDESIPITGFIRSFAKITNTDISEEIEKLQFDYTIPQKPKSIYQQVPTIKASKILIVFLLSFSFLLMVIYILSLSEKKNDKILSLNTSVQIDDDFKDDYFIDQIDMQKEVTNNEKTNYKKLMILILKFYF